ncbi:MAG: hypothetical protein QM731_14600 [Chitinophagaceae bacterium]
MLPRKHLERLAAFLNVSLDELLILWTADKIKLIIENDEIGRQALKRVLKELNK